MFFSVESWTFYDAPLVLFPPVVAALPPLPPPLPPHSLDKERGTSVVKQNHAWLNICFPLWLTSLTFTMKPPRLLVCRFNDPESGTAPRAIGYERLEVPSARQQRCGDNLWQKQITGGKETRKCIGKAKMSPKCCRLLHDNVCCVLWYLNVYFFFKKWVSDLCLSQTWCGTVVLHLAACKNGEGSFLKEVASLAYHLDRAEQGTSRHQWHGSQLRSAHYVGKMPSGERLFFLCFRC